MTASASPLSSSNGSTPEPTPSGSSGSHDLASPPWQRIETTMMATARSIRVAYESCFDSLGLTLSQASAIGYVDVNGPMTQTQLASALMLGRAATGSVIDQLEARELVERVPDAADRRVWLIKNTAEGAAMASRIVVVDKELRTTLRSGISSAQRRQLADLLVAISANAEQATAERIDAAAASASAAANAVASASKQPGN